MHFLPENNAGIYCRARALGLSSTSPVAPGASTFGATLFDGTTGTGSVQGPVAPEPASLMLCVFGGAALLFRRKRFLASRH